MNQNRIGQLLHAEGLPQSSLVVPSQIYQALDRLIRKNTRNPTASFNREIGEQILEQCSQDSNGMVKVGEFSEFLAEAKDILTDRVKETEDKLRNLIQQRTHYEREMVNNRTSGNQDTLNGVRDQLQQLERNIQETQFNLQEYAEDLRDISSPFGQDGNLSRQNISMNNRSVLSPLGDHLAPPAVNQSMRSHSQIFMKRSSGALTLIFYLGLLVFFLELFVMFHKPHFHTLLASIAVLAIFGLNYFDPTYIKLTLGLLMVSVVLDILWILLFIGEYIKQHAFSPNSKLHSTWMRFTILLVIVNTVVKAIIFLILRGYRNVQEVSSITVFGYSISLSGQCKPLRSWDTAV